jgi:hypothetical protein
MMTGAKVILATGMDAARDKLAGLAGASWMMSLPQRRAAFAAHPAGKGRPGPHPGDGTGLIAVMFGLLAAPAADRVVLPVTWEPVAPGDECTIQLDGTITLAPAAEQGSVALTLAGFCRMPPGALNADGREQARLDFMEASREFITSVARDMTRAMGNAPGPEPDGLIGPTWAW